MSSVSPISTSKNNTTPSQTQRCGSLTCPWKSIFGEPRTDPRPPPKLCMRCKETTYCTKEYQRDAWPFHKINCRPQNYILKFQLHPGKIVNPPVERTLSCPAHFSFYDLHQALQTAFGWATTHSFDFAVLDPEYKPPTSASGNELLDLIEMPRRMSMPGSGGRDSLAKREYLLRVIDTLEQTSFSGIDKMHEGSRRHPETVEKRSMDYLLYKFFWG